MAVNFKGAHVPKEIILMCVRWYAAYHLSYRHIEELVEEQGDVRRSRDHLALGRDPPKLY
jgi:putative transposase